MEKLTVYTFCILLLGYVVKCCPPPEEISPYCKCVTGFSGDNAMHCVNLLSTDQLIGPIQALSKHNVKLYSLSIEKSSLVFIPHEIFKGNFVEVLRFVDSEIMALSDTDIAFVGLENSLIEIRATAANYATHWDFQHLRKLKKLQLIDINHINLGSINDPFPVLDKVTAVGIINAEISFIADDVFANLPKLAILNMKDNDITILKRNMFPNPADNLAIIDFSNNKLESLPDNFFDNMPSISSVHLDNNKFITLTEKPFLKAIRDISDFTMNGNPFRCDCRIRWIVDAPIRSAFQAKCESPQAIAGKSLKHLEIKDLWCF